MSTWLKAISKIGWDYCFNLIVLLLHVMVVGFSGNGLSNTELGLPLLSHSLNISWRVTYKIKWIINCFNESRTVFQKVVYVLKVNIIVRLYFKSWHQKLLFWGLTLSLPTQAQQSQAIRTPLHAHTHTHTHARTHNTLRCQLVTLALSQHTPRPVVCCLLSHSMTSTLKILSQSLSLWMC